MNSTVAISLSASFYCRWSFGIVLWELATMGKLVFLKTFVSLRTEILRA